MAVTLKKWNLAYFPVPKVACTSIKHLMFEIENGGRKFEAFSANSKGYHIHKLYPGRLISGVPRKELSDYVRLAVVRDPVKRLLSCYSNRVVHHKELSQKRVGKKLKEAGLPADPDLGTFVDNLEGYQQVQRSIMHHSRPLSAFLGKRPQYFSEVYPIEEIDRFVARVNAITGASCELGRHQTGGPKLKVDELTKPQVDKLKAFYADDYEIFGKYF